MRDDRFAMGFLRVLSRLVPRRLRADWLNEWRGELWHDRARSRQERRPLLFTGRRLLGALPHAVLLRRQDWSQDMMSGDLRYALRSVRRRPGFSLLVAATLALGIGACTAMFTVVHSVLLRPLPYERPDELIHMYGAFSGYQSAAISPPDFLDYRERARSFEALAARTIGGSATLTGNGDAERVSAVSITANFFSTLGVTPLMGRAFLPEEEQGDGHDVTVLSHGLWQRRFAGDRAIVGKAIQVDGRELQVVGVMPPVLDRTMAVDLWRPIAFNTPGTSVRRFHFLRAIGRARAGVTLAGAQAEMDAIARQLEAVYPENATWKLRLVPLRDVVVGTVGPTLLILFGAVALVLLIACGNVASLLLARASARGGEMALRTTLGASRLRLVRQLLVESMVLAFAGGIAGVALAMFLVRGVRVAAQGILPRLAEIEISATVLLFAAGVAVLTGILFGLAPALHLARSPSASLGSSRMTGNAFARRARDVLVIGQVAVSLVLLAGAGLLVRSAWELRNVDAGFQPDGVFTAQLNLSAQRHPTRAAQVSVWSNILERVRALPGVTAASATSMLPLSGGGDTYYRIEGRSGTGETQRPTAQVNVIAPDYAATLGVRIVAGRALNAGDHAGAPPAVMISRGMADRLFPGEPPTGHRLIADFGEPFTAEIVGVMDDVRAFGLSGEPPDIMYFALEQAGGFGRLFFNLVVRTEGDPLSVTRPIRDVVRAIDPDIPLAQVRTMIAVVDESMASERFAARLFASFAVLAVILSIVGLYGVLAWAVAQRTRELGIRLALGASRIGVFRMVLGRGAVIVGAGLALGLSGAFVTTRLLESMLFAVTRTDPLVLGAVTALLAAAAMLACAVPAARATRVEPIQALRVE